MENNAIAPVNKKKKKKGRKKVIFVIAVLLVAAVIFFVFAAITYAEGKVERRTIQTTMSSSGTLQPADSYTVTSSVSGEVLECMFEEGDTVSKDDVLYIVDSSDMENTIDRAQISYDRTLRSYNRIADSLEDLDVYSDYDGIITEVYAEVGDSINAGTKIAQLRDSSVMHMTVPFAVQDAKQLYAGQKGEVIIDGSFETVDCEIEELDSFDSVLNDTAVRYVKVKVNNTDGGIYSITKGVVTFGDTVCLESGTFEYNKEAVITAQTSGDVVSVVSKGDSVKAGETLVCRLESETLENSLTDARSSLEDAELSFNNTKEKLDDYTVKAPITGTVIEKYTKAGDSLDSTKGQTTMAIIYDLSYLKFDMALDELDISKVEVGQKVIISCDAISAGNIEGVITKVSVVGTTNYNSTSYPVTVRIDNPPDGLLAGMNVDAELVIEEAENVLVIPSSAVQRGNTVYIKDDGTKSADDKAPEGYMSVSVETGISNENYIEIKDGALGEGDTVYIPQAVRATTDNSGLFAMNSGMQGQMPSGGMPSGGMPSGGMQGGNRGAAGGGMPSGGMR